MCVSPLPPQTPHQQVLGDSTDELVEKLLAQIKPGITETTDGLSSNAAQTIMDKLRDWLDGEDDEIGSGVKGATEGGEEAPVAELEQLQVEEEVSACKSLHKSTCLPAASALRARNGRVLT